MIAPPIEPDDVRDVSRLLRAHCPLLFVIEPEAARVGALLAKVGAELGMPLFEWRLHRGLARLPAVAGDSATVYKTDTAAQALAFVASANAESIVYLRDFSRTLDDPEIASRIDELHELLTEHRGAVVLSGIAGDLPEKMSNLFTCVRLRAPSVESVRVYVAELLADIRKTRPVTVALDPAGVAELLGQLRGLPFSEVRQLIAEAVVDDGRLDRDDLAVIARQKKGVIERSGLLEYIPVDDGPVALAGLANLRAWLDKRRVAFTEPSRAARLGLPVPRGLLLVGVQGCGKSLSARATAASFQLPLVRLDPSSLYRKYFGESERNFRRALAVAESVAPCILWIDEIEKAFSTGGDEEGGTSRRVLGHFLTWLAEKRELVFVLATANDVTSLPPELLRKGRFDELFFVDLPTLSTRREIFSLHLARHRQKPADFDLDALAANAEGFSGAEIEQAVLSALYAAVSEPAPLSTAHLATELCSTQPLSVTMRERVEALREWAQGRTVPVE